MTRLTAEDIATIWATLALTCKRSRDWDDAKYRSAQMDLWLLALGELPPQVARAAATAYAAEPDRSPGYAGPALWPDPGQVKARAKRLTDEVAGTKALEAADAWGYLQRAMGSRCGIPPLMGDSPDRGRMWADSRIVCVITGRRTEWLNPGDKTLQSGVDTRWTMHREPLTCAAMEAATEGVGGWRAMGEVDPSNTESYSSLRMRWQSAYDVSLRRQRESTADRTILGRLGLQGFGQLEVLDGGKRLTGETKP